MHISESILRSIAPTAPKDVQKYIPFLEGAMAAYNIDTPARISMFLAQIAHESDGFATAEEYASGAAYEGRKDLGNTQPGDGKKFKGRGLVQVTGKTNYAAISKDLYVDFVAHPELLLLPAYAAFSAGWFWNRANLNALADKGDINAVTRKINGGLTGLDKRIAYYNRAKEVIK